MGQSPQGALEWKEPPAREKPETGRDRLKRACELMRASPGEWALLGTTANRSWTSLYKAGIGVTYGFEVRHEPRTRQCDDEGSIEIVYDHYARWIGLGE